MGKSYYNPEYYLKHRKPWNERNRDRMRANDRRYRLRVRYALLKMYGEVCACCGEANKDFLSVDHINGDGTAHRRNFKGVSNSMYRALLKEKRDDIQILCFNCNLGRERNGGICPHKASQR